MGLSVEQVIITSRSSMFQVRVVAPATSAQRSRRVSTLHFNIEPAIPIWRIGRLGAKFDPNPRPPPPQVRFAMTTFKSKLFHAILFCGLAGLLVVSSCVLPTELTSTGGSSGSSGAKCSTGYCLNNGQCCPRAYSDYTYGGHGYAAGCYARCPYVGDCGASTQCF